MRAETPAARRVTGRKLLLLGLGGIVLFATGGMLLSKASPGKPAATAPAPIPVTTQKAASRDLPIERAGLGTVMPINTVDVKARVDGYLQRIAFTDGQEVKAGD
ncbi:MAG: rane fusion protein multidrug efflux system, partial [Alphaproteobacteria bacterium]|nr:rane fusion protein multidrug efflux system [Alphaproteobacteria bacterium]